MFKSFIALASFQVLISNMASAWSVQALDTAITAKSFSDSIMNPKRPLHLMQTVNSSASVEYPSLGSSGLLHER